MRYFQVEGLSERLNHQASPNQNKEPIRPAIIAPKPLTFHRKRDAASPVTPVNLQAKTAAFLFMLFHLFYVLYHSGKV